MRSLPVGRSRRLLATVALLTAVAAGLAGCGDDPSDTSSESSAASSASADSSLAGKVPDAIKADGKILVGNDSSYAPNEFLAADGKTVTGFDVDLFNAVAQKLNLTTEWQSATFDSIIPGVSTGKYTVGVSSFTINAERLKEVNMVSYFSAGTQWAAKTGATINPDDACGKKIAVQTATVQVDDLNARSKKCTDAGKPKITIDQYQKQSDATNAVVTGKDEAMLADSPIAAYAVKQTNGQLALVGDIYDSAPYGYAVDKDQKAFADVLGEAVQALIADGTYKQVLDKWGVTAGAVTTAEVNPSV